MKVFISVDLEGITGVFNMPQTDCDGNFEWVAAVAQMQGDVDAVIAGCDDAGVDEIVICDSKPCPLTRQLCAASRWSCS